jgi:putative ABC transport system permease protein
VQAIVIGLVVFCSTAAATLALGLLADSNAPFNHAFAAQHGADVTATVTSASCSGFRTCCPLSDSMARPAGPVTP